jgi:putative transposase
LDEVRKLANDAKLNEGTVPLVDRTRMLHDYSPTAWKLASERLEAARGGATHGYSERSIRAFKSAIQNISDPMDQLLLLIDRASSKGNRNKRFDATEEQILSEAAKNYNNSARPTKTAAYAEYLNFASIRSAANANVIRTRSYQSFCRALDQLVDLKARQGRKAHYQQKALELNLEEVYSTQGAREHEVVQADHTLLPIATRSSSGTKLGKPWLSVCICEASRKTPALWISYDPPSAGVVLMLLRDYVRRNLRLPDILYVDNGSEFHSDELHLFCKIYRIDLRYRVAEEPRSGAIIERLLGKVMEELIQNLAGNTTNMKDPSKVSPEVNGFNNAKWSLQDLYRKVEGFFLAFARIVRIRR